MLFLCFLNERLLTSPLRSNSHCTNQMDTRSPFTDHVPCERRFKLNPFGLPVYHQLNLFVKKHTLAPTQLLQHTGTHLPLNTQCIGATHAIALPVASPSRWHRPRRALLDGHPDLQPLELLQHHLQLRRAHDTAKSWVPMDPLAPSQVTGPSKTQSLHQ